MLRRRGLSGFFKFGIKGPSDSKYTDSTSLTFPYGIEKNITIWELGTVVGNNVGYTTFTEDGEEKTYCVLSGRGKGLENIAFLNFTTYKEQDVVIKIKDICDNENDFLAVCHLDATDKDHIYSMISGNSSKTVTFTNVAPGPHFVKIYYYQHNDSDDVYPSTPAHILTTHAGYFRLEPWTHIYDKGYSKPATQTVKIKSYYGWDLVSKPEWVSLNMTYAKSGSKSLKITLNGNHSVERTGSIVLRERKNNTDITINITQGANDEPNDILLSYEGGGTTADGNSVTNIKVKVKGDTTYSVSNPNNTEYSISYPTPVAITDEENGDGAYADMSVRESTLTITKKKTGNVNPVTFRIYTSSVSKDVIINSDKISCYCDCNQYNRCQCDIETRNYKQEFSECPLYSYNCSVHDANANNCNGHCSANENYTECSGHSTCISVDICDGHVASRYCTSDTLDTCGSKSLYCTSDTLDTCSGHYNYCTSDKLDTCSGHSNYCTSDTLDTCSGYSTYCTSNTNDTCSGHSYYCTSDTLDTCGSQSTKPNFSVTFKFSWTANDRPTSNSTLSAHYLKLSLSDSVTLYMNSEYPIYTSSGASSRQYSIPGGAIGKYIRQADFYADNGTIYKLTTANMPGSTQLLQNYTIEFKGSSYPGGGTGSFSGRPFEPSCTGYSGGCSSDVIDTCGSKCGSNGCNYSLNYCGSKCGSNGCNYAINYCGSKCGSNGCNYAINYCGSKCGSNGCNYAINYCGSKCAANGCNSNTLDTCGSKCESDGCNYSTCPSQRFDCTCYTKLYYPYCECVGFCECYNYSIPTICDAHNCKADEINSCTCNSQVTCPPKS